MGESLNRSKPRHCHELRDPSIDLDRELSPLRKINKQESSPIKEPNSSSTYPNSHSHKQSTSLSSTNKTRSFQTSSSSNSKDAFRNLTQEILNLELLQRQSNQAARSEPAEPAKFDPMSVTSLEVPIMLSEEQSSYRNISQANPFYDDYQALWKMSPETQATSPSPSSSPRACSYPSETGMPLFPRHMPHSMSENHIAPSVRIGRHEPLHVHFQDYEEERPSYETRDRSPVRRFASPTRGRNRERILDDMHEDRDFDFMESPPRRSRSPHKKLFGENGWLGRSTSMKELPNEKYRKTTLKTLGEKIKQHVEGLAGDVAKAYPFRQEFSHPKIVSKSTFPISLDPPTQAKVYSEMEVMICVSANKFLVQQYKEGHLSVESINKVTNFWASKNRPQVLEFQFDQATQRDLILHNIRTLMFNGESATNPIVLNSTLYNWKAVAKEMSVRTFCHPDSVIRKHMHDIYKILEMLGAPLVTFLAFQELQMRTLTLMKEQIKKNYQPRNSNGYSRSSSDKRDSNDSY